MFSHPTEGQRGRPAESVTHHEACLSAVPYIGMNRFSKSHTHSGSVLVQASTSHARLEVPSIFHHGHVSLIRRCSGCCYGKVEDSAALPPLRAGEKKNNLACAASHSNPICHFVSQSQCIFLHSTFLCFLRWGVVYFNLH